MQRTYQFVKNRNLEYRVWHSLPRVSELFVLARLPWKTRLFLILTFLYPRYIPGPSSPLSIIYTRLGGRSSNTFRR